jgi:hypothetical protein
MPPNNRPISNNAVFMRPRRATITPAEAAANPARGGLAPAAAIMTKKAAF